MFRFVGLHGGVVNGHTVLTCTLVVQRSLTVLRPSQALHDPILGEVSNTVFAIFPIVAYRTCIYVVCIEAGRRRGIIDTRRRHQWAVGFSLKGFRCKCMNTPDTRGVEDAQYLSIYVC